MIGCDNPNCQFEWFHYRCVGLTRQVRYSPFSHPPTLLPPYPLFSSFLSRILSFPTHLSSSCPQLIYPPYPPTHPPTHPPTYL